VKQLQNGNVAVIFVSRRTGVDAEVYALAAAEMEAEVARAPGYLGHDSVGSPDGQGITISYWDRRGLGSQVAEDMPATPRCGSRGEPNGTTITGWWLPRLAAAYDWHK
jgi:hypothetical protein